MVFLIPKKEKRTEKKWLKNFEIRPKKGRRAFFAIFFEGEGCFLEYFDFEKYEKIKIFFFANFYKKFLKLKF